MCQIGFKTFWIYNLYDCLTSNDLFFSFLANLNHVVDCPRSQKLHSEHSFIITDGNDGRI